MTVRFRVVEEPDDAPALLLPYLPDNRNGRTNSGFRDLRGDPESARLIPEAETSPALQNLLVSLAHPGARFISIGCEIGAAENFAAPRPHEAGGYIQVVYSDLRRCGQDHRWQTQLAESLRATLETAVGDHEWAVEVLITVVGAAIFGGPDQVWSPVIQFFAFGFSNQEAELSREEMIKAIQSCLA